MLSAVRELWVLRVLRGAVGTVLKPCRVLSAVRRTVGAVSGQGAVGAPQCMAGRLSLPSRASLNLAEPANWCVAVRLRLLHQGTLPLLGPPCLSGVRHTCCSPGVLWLCWCALQENKARSRYEEDVLINNHSAVWGSYWKDGNWGYACCHQVGIWSGLPPALPSSWCKQGRG